MECYRIGMKKKPAPAPKEPVTIKEITWHEKCTHRVLYPAEDGKRKSKYFTNETDALEFAEQRRAELGVNGSGFGTITADERAALSAWRAFTAGRNAPDLLTVVRDYSAKWKERNESITITEAAERYLAHQEAEGASARHLASLKSRIGRLSADHGAALVSTLDAGTFSDWLNGLRGTRADKEGAKLSLLTRENLKKTIRSFYGYCIERGWTSTNPVPVTAKKRTREHRLAARKAPEIMEPEKIAAFLHKIEETAPEILPFWLVKFFAGIRDAEAARLDWSMVDLKAGMIRLPASITKTGDQRTVKIEPVLADWLAPLAATSGPLAPSDTTRRYYYKKVLRHLRKPAKKGGKPKAFVFPSNAARHSFATYHLYAFRHPGETAMQLGHKGDPGMLWEHYANPHAEEHAEQFWKLKSSKPNVVSIRKGRKASA